MGQHHATVSAGTQYSSLRGPLRHHTNGSLGAALQMIRDRLHREVQVGPRIPVWDWEHIDAIQFRTLQLRPVAARRESPPEPRSIDIADLHSARSTLTR